ncbi:HEAT repeat domain-containing protein [Paenibacillus silvae]|uniref:HEAT repeat domain-containing protein n=1 Tax=Paenibacillus TaxID=44249 RepID=UPI001C0F7D45|nr:MULTISPECIES: HEAT repeat domain-containing protein [Paenibacillus]MBU5353144.1 HEAT repeat domain-containing protein [Paenibacillus barcinonensis]MDM5280738.1 HEAT repeat domain-containing protein [Paenibacillus silvae]
MTNNHDIGAVNELPENFEELKRAANRTSSWRDRLNSVNELGNWDTAPTIKLLHYVLKNDQVFQVREAAYLKLKQLHEDVQMPAKNKGELFKGTNKILLRIKKSLPEGHTFEEFKEKLQKTRLDIYDTYEGDKDAEFDSWLHGIWETLGRR